MIVTNLNYHLEDRLVERLNSFSEMVTRKKQIQDVAFTIHGKTGTGKTNASVVIGYYLKTKTNRDLNLFFSTEKACDFAKKTSEKIIIIDEPSLDSLSKDQLTKVSKNFFRLLNTMRQKRHIVIVNITRFWRFPFDLVVDRSLAMINMYNKDGKDPGRFHYIRQKNLERLWDAYQKKHLKLFGKLKSFGGWIPERMETLDTDGVPYFNKMGIIINGKENCTYEDYKKFRDMEVASIGETTVLTKKEIESKNKLYQLRYKVALLAKAFNLKQEDLAKYLGTGSARLREWKSYEANPQISLGLQALEVPTSNTIINTLGRKEKNFDDWDEGDEDQLDEEKISPDQV